MILGEIDDVIHHKDWFVLLLQKFSIHGAHPKRDDAPGVSKDSITHFLLDLGHVLIGQDEVQVILTSLRENVSK